MKKWLFLAFFLAQAASADTPVVQGTDYAHGLLAGRYIVTGPEQGGITVNWWIGPAR